MDGSSDFDLDYDGIELPESCDVAIVGSGLAGLATAAHLWHTGRRDFILIDPHHRPAAQFFERVDLLHQTVMRSPYEHHPGAEGYSDCELLDFARFNWNMLTPHERGQIRMAQSGQRSVVPLDVFQAFCARVASLHEIPNKTVHAKVAALSSCSGGILVTTTIGQMKAAHVVVAVGETPIRAPADWEVPEGGPVSYWDQPGSVTDSDCVAIIGSGLSAAHLIRFNLSQGKRVIWIQRSQEKYQCADVDASFFRPEGRAQYAMLGPTNRAALVRHQRTPSIMFEFSPGLRKAEEVGQLIVHRNAGSVRVRVVDSHSVTILIESGQRISTDHVILAFGTRPATLPKLWAHQTRHLAIENLHIDNDSLKVMEMGSLYVSGAWATTALGPAARNIDGHRVAVHRICADIMAGA